MIERSRGHGWADNEQFLTGDRASLLSIWRVRLELAREMALQATEEVEELVRGLEGLKADATVGLYRWKESPTRSYSVFTTSNDSQIVGVILHEEPTDELTRS